MTANYLTPAFEFPTLSTKAISATGTTANVQFQSSNLSGHVRIVNSGTSIAFVEFGESAVTAVVPTGTAVGSMPILGGSQIILRGRRNFVAAITAGTTATTLYITPGDGGL